MDLSNWRQFLVSDLSLRKLTRIFCISFCQKKKCAINVTWCWLMRGNCHWLCPSCINLELVVPKPLHWWISLTCQDFLSNLQLRMWRVWFFLPLQAAVWSKQILWASLKPEGKMRHLQRVRWCTAGRCSYEDGMNCSLACPGSLGGLLDSCHSS